MPTGKHERQFAALFISEIERHRDLAEPAIMEILEAQPPAEVKVLLLQTFSDWNWIPIQVFSMSDKSPDESYFKRPFSGRLIKKTRKLVRERIIDQDQFEDLGIDTFSVGHRLLAEWIGKIWMEQGGSRYRIPAYIGAHDSSRLLDLRKTKWIDESKVWA